MTMPFAPADSATAQSESIDIHALELRSPSRGSIWNRYSTLINFWLDLILLILFLIQAWMFSVLNLVFPRGASAGWKIWGANALDWSEALFVVFCVFSLGILLHVMLHWGWVCGVATTRFLKRKSRKDDGYQTVVGVAVLILLIHLLVLGILIALVNLIAPR